MSSDGEGSAFDQWYNGLVGFHINSERILYELFEPHQIKPVELRKWMTVCWNAAVDATLNEAQDYQWETQPEVCRAMCETTLKA